MDKDKLVKSIQFWRESVEQDILFPRLLSSSINLESGEVIDIIGPRRSGKSSLMKLLIKKLPAEKKWLYMNFEDPFFIEHNTPQTIQDLVEISREYFDSSLEYLFFDEIQAVEKWETAIRKLRDSGRYKICIAGSSSKLLSTELSTVLSGRHISFQLLPLSFTEYLTFKGISITEKRDIIVKSVALEREFERYLACGGFPQIAITENQELLKQYYYDIVERDILNRHHVREQEVLKKLGVFLISNSAKTISVASLKKLYGISHTLAAKYVEYFKETFLVFDVSQFSYSLKTQQKALKKIYAGDTGLASVVSFRFSEDKGRMLENAVLLQLKRMKIECFYFKSQNSEVDFIVKKDIDFFEALQVSWSIYDEKTRMREIKGIKDAARQIKIRDAKILTFNESESQIIHEENIDIQVQPVYQWILELEAKTGEAP